MEVPVLLFIVGFLEAGQRLVAGLEQCAITFLGLRSHLERKIRKHLLEHFPDLAEVFDRIHARILARDDEQVVDSRRADRLGLETNFVHRQIPANRPSVRGAEIAITARVDARIADIQRRIHADRLSIVPDSGLARLAAHFIHERIGRRREQVQQIEPVATVLHERRAHHRRRNLGVILVDLFLGILEEGKHSGLSSVSRGSRLSSLSRPSRSSSRSSILI